MTKSEVLRLQVARMLANGALPQYPGDSIVAGDGDGLPCAVCAKTINYGVQYEMDDAARGRLRMHMKCYLAWRNVCIESRTEHRQ